MEFDWSNPPFSLEELSIKEIEEAFEDPFALRLLPDETSGKSARFCLLGRAVSGIGIFCVFRTDGKNYRVIAARKMNSDETNFYDRKASETVT